jgi:uncharacterized membrane protein
MTLLGTAGGVVGAGFIAGLAVIVGPRSSDAGGAVAVAGIAGMLVDSLLGATVQGKVTWFDNDVVNLAATFAGAAIAAAAWQLRA